jgi:uncharacterized coiled-coil protein SlyX
MRKSNIDLKKVPLSKKSEEELTFTVADQQFIKRALDLQNDIFNEAFDKNIVELTAALAEVIQAQNEKMFAVLGEQTKQIEAISKNVDRIVGRLDKIEKRLDGIETNLTDKENRLVALEVYASFKQTLIRHTVAAIIWLSVGLCLGYYLHSLL